MPFLIGAGGLVLLVAGMGAAADKDRKQLETWSGTISLVVIIVPFAGLAFLWFTGVIRNRLGDREDLFFATILLGSGIISVVIMIVFVTTIE